MSLNNGENISINATETFTKVDNVERAPELLTVDFGSYETICNYNNDGSRRRGILSEEMYQEIVEDPTTGFINTGDHRIPVLMDVKHGLSMGYDSARCEEYSKDLAHEAKILTLPVHELNEDEKEQLAVLLSNSKNAIYFGDHNGDESKALSELLNKTGLEYFEKPLLDSRITNGDQQASLSLYSCRTEKVSENGEIKKVSFGEVYSCYLDNIGPSESNDGKTLTKLDMGNDLSDEAAEEFWGLYNDRFDFLGENHPISMQDSEEDFLGLLRSADTVVSSTYIQDENNEKKLACFTYFVDGIDGLYWLNQGFLSKRFVDGEDNKNVTNVFTPGVVSSAVGTSYSLLSMALFTKSCDVAGISTNLLFENTNFSKCYIPTFVDRVMSRTCKNAKVTHKSTIEDEVSYRLWSIGGEEK